MTDKSELKNQASSTRFSHARLLLVVIAALGCVAVIVVWWSSRPDVSEQLRLAKAGFLQEDYQQAQHAVERILQGNPDLLAANVLAGDIAFAQEDYDRALEHYQQVPTGSQDLQVHARLRCGRIQMHHTGNAPAAEAAFRTALQYVPNDRNALFQLASLLGIQARRHEAVPFILRLFRQGIFHLDFLKLLEEQDGALFNIEELQRYQLATPGAAGVLRGQAWHTFRNGDPGEAIGLLRQALDSDPDFVPAQIALAKLLLEQKRWPDLRPLMANANEAVQLRHEWWWIRGQLAEHNGQTAAAARCNWETLQRQPTDHPATWKLFQYATAAGHDAAAKWLQARVDQLLQIRTAFNQAASLQYRDAESVARLVPLLEQTGRLWEAWGWCMVLREIAPRSTTATQDAERLFQALQTAEPRLVCVPPTFPFDFSELPLPRSEKPSATQQRNTDSPVRPATFRDDATAAGLRFQYFNSASPGNRGQRMYEFNGGGTGILDIDADGWPDIYLTQGCRWADRGQQQSDLDRLFRNRWGQEFEDVTNAAGVFENAFSTGLAVGDFNNDGFADCYVSNIGDNRLLLNSGDGTFRDVSAAADVADPAWSTSSALADLNGDGLPDLYSVNYLEGEGVFETVCQHDDGRPRMCMPFHFPGAQDQLYLNQGNGTFINATATSGIQVEDGKGLGVVVANWQDDRHPEIFVANDTVANAFFVRPESVDDRATLFEDRAMTAGVALNQDGRAEGCMGIAVGDADNDGVPDLFVTNFLFESNTFYQGTPQLYFSDRTSAVALEEPGLSMLGFGTQFLDANLNGHLDLIVANGHIDDYRPYGRPYRMSPQFYHNTGDGQFAVQSAQDSGPYFTQQYLGRSLARCDWNRDGREDVVISNLDQPAALLTNTTKPHGRFLALQLRGVAAARDAVGATVTARVGGRTIRRQITAGDGYQASNQRSLIFGLADQQTVDRVDVTWPSGVQESFGALPADRHYLLVEGSGRAYRMDTQQP